MSCLFLFVAPQALLFGPPGGATAVVADRVDGGLAINIVLATVRHDLPPLVVAVERLRERLLSAP
jgi:hypothetical protein